MSDPRRRPGYWKEGLADALAAVAVFVLALTIGLCVTYAFGSGLRVVEVRTYIFQKSAYAKAQRDSMESKGNRKSYQPKFESRITWGSCGTWGLWQVSGIDFDSDPLISLGLASGNLSLYGWEKVEEGFDARSGMMVSRPIDVRTVGTLPTDFNCNPDYSVERSTP